MIKKITKNIFISGAEEIIKKDLLKEFDITAILNVAWELNDPAYSVYDFKIVKVGLMNNQENLAFLKNLSVIALGSLLDNGETVLVHDMHGVNRAPYVVMRYLAEKEKRTIESLYEEFIPQFPNDKIIMSPLIA